MSNLILLLNFKQTQNILSNYFDKVLKHLYPDIVNSWRIFQVKAPSSLYQSGQSAFLPNTGHWNSSLLSRHLALRAPQMACEVCQGASLPLSWYSAVLDVARVVQGLINSSQMEKTVPYSPLISQSPLAQTLLIMNLFIIHLNKSNMVSKLSCSWITDCPHLFKNSSIFQGSQMQSHSSLNSVFD